MLEHIRFEGIQLKINKVSNRLVRFAVILLSLGLVFSGSVSAASLVNGDVLSDAISISGEVDTHTFTANAGDTIYLRIADTETTQFNNAPFFPKIEVLDPSGTSLINSGGALVGDILFAAVVSGTFTVLASDDSGGNDDETGTYNLYYTKVPGANEGGELVSGTSVTDRIDLGDIDSYTFSANAGETVLLRVADKETTTFINADFFPEIALYDPNGSFLIRSSGALVGDLVQSLVMTGTYTVIVIDESSGEDAVGDYELFFVKAPGAVEGGTLPNGGLVSGEITLGDLDSYTFAANAGDSVYLRVADTETTEFIPSDFFPQVDLFDPSGALLLSGNGQLVGDIFASLTVSGNYTVVVRDESSGEDAIGSYNLYFTRAPGANEGGMLVNGESISDQIDLGDIDSYTFSANAGDSVYIDVADTESTEFIPSDFFPRVALYDPNGAFIVAGFGQLVGRLFSQLTMTGTYTVTVVDESSGEDATGTYDLYFAKAPGADELSGIAGGNLVSEFIDLGDIDTFAFSVDTLGSSITATITDLDNSDFFPRMELFDPNGNFVTSASGSVTDDFTATLVQPGLYTLVIYDNSSGDDAIGNYGVSVIGNISEPSSGPLLCNGLAVTVNLGLGESPTQGNDVILGTSGVDDFNALGGNDTICAEGGNDRIDAGPGGDWVDGGTGSDTIFGRAGDDEIYGDTGNDVISGGGGNDTIEGEGGNDTLSGQTGDDFINGGNGVDAINGGSGRDTIFTGSGATVGTGLIVTGSIGNDTIHGGPDADMLIGNNGADEIFGEGGNDVITGGIGLDIIDGGDGDDTISGQSSGDRINGGAGNDSINGGSGNDVIDGEAGDDMLAGSSDNDTVIGGAGNDQLLGGNGDDRLFGGGGASDFCDGQNGVDTAAASCETVVRVP